MNVSLRALRRLDIVSMIVIAVAVGIYAWPVSADIAEQAAPPLAGVALRVTSEPDTLDALQVASANILSASRRAPVRRYLSPDATPASDFSMPAAFATPVDSPGTSNVATDDDADAVPALYGTVNTDGTWRALVRLSSSDPNPTLLKEGEKRGAYRIISIRSNAVVVAGPSGQRTLRLARPARGDSIGKSP